MWDDSAEATQDGALIRISTRWIRFALTRVVLIRPCFNVVGADALLKERLRRDYYRHTPTESSEKCALIHGNTMIEWKNADFPQCLRPGIKENGALRLEGAMKANEEG